MARFSILVLFGHINLCSESSSPPSSPTHYWKMLVFALLTLTSAIESVLSDEVMPPEIPNLKQAANGGASRLSQCENGTLNECWSQIPPFPDQGIPSSPESVAASCQAFDKGMSCVHGWTKKCLSEENRKKIMDSVRGAHEAYTFLCRDEKFRNEFLAHSVCYKRVSPHWDECANKFINTLKSLSPVHFDNPANLCCIRRSFKRCVSEVSHHYCSREASLFLLRMAETLVRNNIRVNTPQPETCDVKSMENECDRNVSTLNSSSWCFPSFMALLLLLSGFTLS